MVKFRWNKMLLFLTLLLQFTAVTGQIFLSFTVRDGDEVTLPCENLIRHQDRCGSTIWLFSVSRNTAAVKLIEFGQIGKKAKAKSDRLSVTANCSLVIKKVTVEDVGRYTCRQFKSGQQYQDSVVDLSVVTMTEHKDTDKVTLNCSVSTYDECRHTVKWLYRGNDWDVNTRHAQTSQSTCSITASFLTFYDIYTSNYKLLKCKVTDLNSGKVQLYNFSPQLSCEKPGEEGKTTTTQPTTVTTNENITESRKRTGVAETTTQEGVAETTTQEERWWLYVLLAVVLAALLIIVVVLIRRKRAEGNKTQMNDSTGLSLNPAETQPAPETSQDTDDPEGGVSYASINYTRKTDSKARVQGKDDADEDDAVTYSTVKASSSSAAASTDPSNATA
ncbi:uncharacterized protein [Thunnus thynnus]|uniref:uncharacterized protein isoform X1 n=1 Tax=Thunnus thynnus TaxID=8237 RepID=UPI003528374D